MYFVGYMWVVLGRGYEWANQEPIIWSKATDQTLCLADVQLKLRIDAGTPEIEKLKPRFPHGSCSDGYLSGFC